MEGVDYSFTRPGPACLKHSGKHFAVRYIGTPSSGKNLTLTETEHLQKVNVDLVAVYQTTTGFMVDGTTSGITAATKAHTNAIACGMPADRPIYFALDMNPNTLLPVEWGRLISFLTDAAVVLGPSRVGLYGAYTAIERMVPEHAAYGWQTFAWSAGAVSEKACLYQYRNGVAMCGATVDLCRSFHPDFGQWTYQDTEDDDMQAEDWVHMERLIADSEARIVRQIVGNKPLIVAYDDAVPGGPDHWYAIGPRVRVELTQDDAAQGVAEGTLRWWNPDHPGEPLRVPRATLDSIPTIE